MKVVFPKEATRLSAPPKLDPPARPSSHVQTPWYVTAEVVSRMRLFAPVCLFALGILSSGKCICSRHHHIHSGYTAWPSWSMKFTHVLHMSNEIQYGIIHIVQFCIKSRVFWHVHSNRIARHTVVLTVLQRVILFNLFLSPLLKYPVSQVLKESSVWRLLDLFKLICSIESKSNPNKDIKAVTKPCFWQSNHESSGN